MTTQEFRENGIDMSMVDALTAPSMLRSAFGGAALDEAQVSLIHKIAHAQENMVLLGQGAGNIAGVIERGAASVRSTQDISNRLKQQSKRTFDTQMMLSLLDQQIAFLGDRIAEAEKGFVEKYGDAWAEELALEILDPDEIPEKEATETIEEYRERLKPLLIERMLDENGEIKPEYKDHPKYGEFADWAKDQHDMRPLLEGRAKIDEIQNDPSRSEAEKDADTREVLDGMNLQELEESYENETLNNSAQAIAQAEIDARMDEHVSAAPASSTFDAFG